MYLMKSYLLWRVGMLVKVRGMLVRNCVGSYNPDPMSYVTREERMKAGDTWGKVPDVIG